VGDECFIGDGAQIGAGVKVYSFKTVESGAVVNRSLVWESRGARALFGRNGVTGLANVDITPALATKLAMAYGSTLRKGTTVVASRDSSRSARMLGRAFMAGLNAAGVDVLDLEVASVPVTRFLVRSPVGSGGVTVRLVAGDPQSVVFRFFDADGLDVTEDQQRKIERLYAREDFRRVFASEIGDIGYPPRALEQYTAALEETVDVSAVADGGFKLVVDYGFGSTSFVMPQVLAKLGADVLGVNPYAATSGAMEFDRATHAELVASLVRASGAKIGAVIDPDGEHLTVIDDEGRVLDDATTLMAFVSLVSGHLLGDQIALPVNVSRAVEDLVAPAGVRVRYTKTSTPALMDAATETGVGFAASNDGGYILPGFLPAFDAAASLVKLLELLAVEDTTLSAVVDDLPRVHLAHEVVVTPWEQKGLVMRSLVEHSKDRELVLVDGV
jgi:mannose-1-phosphate guanylyltransferase/phosphomannomutase